jgi:signal transduction histidine kinase/integral membrane sensor domain MASE1
VAYEQSVGLVRSASTPAQTIAVVHRLDEMRSSIATATGVAVVYFLAAKLGEALAFPSAPVSALWAPNAILFAALLLAPVRRWWLYLLAILPFHLAAQLPVSPIEQVAVQYVANCAESILGAAALLWLEPDPKRFDRLSTMANLIVLGSIAAPLVTSATMACAFVALNLTDEFWLTTIARTMTNTFATMTLVPLIVHGATTLRRGHSSLTLRRAAEALLITNCLLIAGAIVFIVNDAQYERLPALLYAPVPLLLWATVRFDIVGASGSILLLGALATWGVLHDAGPFVDRLPVQNALSLVLFLNVTCAPLLLLAAVLQERKEATAALHKSEMLHRSVLASLQDQIAVVDNAGVVLESNDSWRRARELTEPQLVAGIPGDNYLAATISGTQRGEPVYMTMRDALRAVLSGRSSRRELEFSCLQRGEMHSFELSIEALQRPERGAVITLSDVTTRRCAELEVQEQQQQLAHLARVAILGEFSGAIAHEIRQPLAATLANAEAGALLLAAERIDVDAVREILEDIIADSVRAAQVVQRLRSMLHNVESQRQVLQLNDLVQESLMLARVDLARRGVIVVANLDPNLPCVPCDRVQIQQVILNLIVNGYQAMAPLAASAKRLTVTTCWAAESREVELAVIDSGEGIEESLLERIFQPFVTTKADGLGLGLSISRSIVSAHGGRLWAENMRTGTGAAFHVTLPIRADG